MDERHNFLYEAFKAKDTRFDGRFFVGISSTKIYCRPVCHARQAKPENCTFFSSAAEAEQAGYRPPYQWDKILGFLSQRAIPGVETVENGAYMRTVRVKGRNEKEYFGTVAVKQGEKKDMLTVSINDTLIPVLPQILSRIKNLFDLYCEPDTIYDTLQSMNEIRQGFCVKGTRVPGCFDSFEMAVRAILGQQITVKAASTLAGKIAKAYGRPLETGIDSLTHTFPTAEDMIALDGNIAEHLGVLGVIASRSNSILALAKELAEGNIQLDRYADPKEEMAKLQQIKGIGSWTAKYIAIRTMGWTDAFLETDIGIKHALPDCTPKERLELSERWRPWRSYVTVNLWNTL